MEEQKLIEIMKYSNLYKRVSTVKEAIEFLEKENLLRGIFERELTQEELKEVKSMTVYEVNSHPLRRKHSALWLYKDYTKEENALFNFLLKNQRKINELMTKEEKAIFKNIGCMDPADFVINRILPKLSAMSK